MSIPICPSCHQPGHSRRTHRDCLMNAARLSIRTENEIIFVNNQEQRNHSSNDSGSLQQQSVSIISWDRERRKIVFINF